MFGTPVKIERKVLPVYGTIASDAGMLRLTNLSVRGKQLPDCLWPGLPIPDPQNKQKYLEPMPPNVDQGVYRRLRRVEFQAKGVIVGQVVRCEGTYFSGSSWNGSFYEDDFPSLLTTRQVKLWQVAIASTGKAIVVDVYEEDVK